MTPTRPLPREAAERRELAAALRTLREARKLSQPQLADRLGWTQSRVSRIERGTTRPSPTDVDQWADETDATPDTRRHLMSLAENAAVELTDWKRALAPGRVRKQQEIAQLEEAASVIRVFGADVIPGLAQTRAYAASMFLLGRVDVTDEPEQLDAVLDSRMARQSVLDNTGKQIKLLMSEIALRRHLVTGAEQRDQIDQLIAVRAARMCTSGSSRSPPTRWCTSTRGSKSSVTPRWTTGQWCSRRRSPAPSPSATRASSPVCGALRAARHERVARRRAGGVSPGDCRERTWS